MAKYSVTVSATSAQELAEATEKVSQALAVLADVSASVAISVGGGVVQAVDIPQGDDIYVHEGAPYRKVKRVGKEGELAVIIACYFGHEFPIGEVVRFIDDDGHAEYLDGNDYWSVGEVEYVVLEPLNAQVVYE